MNIIPFFLIVVFSFSFSCCFYNDFSNKDEQIYKMVLEYIKSDSTSTLFISQFKNSAIKKPLKICVSPIILPADVAGFSSTVLKNKKVFILNNKRFDYKNSILDSLLSFEKEIEYNSYVCEGLEDINCDKDADAIVYFSKVFENFVTVTLYYNRDPEVKKSIPDMLSALTYLIIFDSNEIKSILYEELHN